MRTNNVNGDRRVILNNNSVPLPPCLGSQQNAAIIVNDGSSIDYTKGSFISCKNFQRF